MTSRCTARADSACDLVFYDDGGSIVAIHPHSDAGLDWLADNCATEPWQWLGNRLCVERRYAFDILNGALADGLVCEGPAASEDDLDAHWQRIERAAVLQ